MGKELSGSPGAVLGQAEKAAAQVQKGPEEFTLFPGRLALSNLKVLVCFIEYALVEGA